MSTYDRIIEIMGAWLSMANQTLSVWVDMPENATGPLDPGIGLTATGVHFVNCLAQDAIDTAFTLYQALESLF